MISVAETGPFERKIKDLLSAQECADLIAYLAEHPNAGVLIQGTGGIRKLRWARQGRGIKWRYPGRLLFSQRFHALVPAGRFWKERKGQFVSTGKTTLGRIRKASGGILEATK